MFTIDTSLLLELLRRVLFAALCGVLIGLERDVHGRAAGLRTHTLVAIGSAVFTLISILIVLPNGLGQELYGKDIARVAAQVVSGIGFLGAGTIIKSGFTVKGLTTAACLWFVSALGMACGIGLCLPAVAVALLGLLVVFSGKCLERKLHRLYPFQLCVEAQNGAQIEEVKAFLEQMPGHEITSLSLNIIKGASPIYRATFHLDTSISLSQPDACIKLTRSLFEQYPTLLAVTYKCEG